MLFNHGILKSVKLSNANLTGTIPMLTSLFELELQGNALTGPLPAVLPTTLQRLLLGRNKLTGTLPAYTQLGPTALQYFDASFNNLSGGLRPEWVGSMAGLRDLFLQGNNLTGTLPPEVGIARTAHAVYCTFTAVLLGLRLVESSRGSVGVLKWWGLAACNTIEMAIAFINGQNLFAANICLDFNTQPAGWMDVLNLDISSVCLLSLRCCVLQWSGLSQLGSLDLSGNKLSGQLPITWNNMTSMQNLNLSGNTFAVRPNRRCWFPGGQRLARMCSACLVSSVAAPAIRLSKHTLYISVCSCCCMQAVLANLTPAMHPVQETLPTDRATVSSPAMRNAYF
jgi:Leucine-rich repeat (LRR) protein